MDWEHASHLKQAARIGFYVHVPFCPHICPYCDFVKTSRFTKADVEHYFEGLLAQTQTFLSWLSSSHTHATVYFGGGTPGLIEARFYAPIIELVAKRLVIDECTIETNPFTNSGKKIRDYKQIGINRITLGAQSLCEKTLSVLGRKHAPGDVLTSLDAALEAGISQVQVDLIYGIKPGVRSRTLQSEIETLVQHGATGLSAYALTIEKRTLFANADWADDDIAANEYEELYQSCTSLGLRQVETSNFSRFEAQHNNLYWYGLPYFGIGTGAHGLLPSSPEAPYGIRYSVGAPAKEWSAGDDNLQALSREQKFEIRQDVPRTAQQFGDELIFTMLRTPKGLPLKRLEHIFGSSLIQKLTSDEKIKRALQENRMTIEDSFLSLDWREKIRGDSWALHISWILGTKEIT